jgi:hypothetical protein
MPRVCPATGNPWATILWHTARMPDDIHSPGDRDYRPRSVTVTVSADAIAARLAELPTRKEMYRAVLTRRNDWRLPRAVPSVDLPLGARPYHP